MAKRRARARRPSTAKKKRKKSFLRTLLRRTLVILLVAWLAHMLVIGIGVTWEASPHLFAKRAKVVDT